jgi:mRNA interferase MazF
MRFQSGDVVWIDFPGVTGIKRRPAVVLSSNIYQTTRPDIIVGLITSQTTGLGVTDYELQDWATAGLRLKSAFRCFLVTLPATAKPTLIGHWSTRDWQGVRNSVKTSLADLNDP